MCICDICGNMDGLSYWKYKDHYYCDNHDCQMELSEIVYNDRYVKFQYYPEIYIEGEYSKNLPNEIKKLEGEIESRRKK